MGSDFKSYRSLGYVLESGREKDGACLYLTAGLPVSFRMMRLSRSSRSLRRKRRGDLDVPRMVVSFLENPLLAGTSLKIYHIKTHYLFRKETVMHTSKKRNSIKENEFKFNHDLYTQIIEKIFAQRDLKTVRLTIGEAVLTAEATGVREDNALILDAIKHTLLHPDAYLNMWEMRCLAGNGDFYQYVDFDPFMLSMSVMIGLPSGCAVRRTTFDLNENMAEGNFAHLYDYSNGDDHTTNDIDEAIEFG